MNRFKAIYLPAIILIALFILGQIAFVPLFGLFEPKIQGISFVITERDGIVKTSVLFSLTLVLIPILIALTWRFAPITSMGKKIASILTIAVFIIAGIVVRHQQVKMYFTRAVKPYFLAKGMVNVKYPIDPVNFVYYMLGGLCIGCIVSWVLFRQK